MYDKNTLNELMLKSKSVSSHCVLNMFKHNQKCLTKFTEDVYFVKSNFYCTIQIWLFTILRLQL